MSPLAFAAFALVLMTHAAYPLIGSLYPDPDAAARAWFYVLRGIEGAVLFVLVAMLVREVAVWLVCAWGALEEAMTAVCRLAKPMGGSHQVLGGGLCDDVLPFPVYLTGLAVAFYVWSRYDRR